MTLGNIWESHVFFFLFRYHSCYILCPAGGYLDAGWTFLSKSKAKRRQDLMDYEHEVCDLENKGVQLFIHAYTCRQMSE